MPSENYIVIISQQEQPKVFLFTGNLKLLIKQCRHEVAQDGRVSIHSLEPAKFQPKLAFDGVKLQQVGLVVSHEDPAELLEAFIQTTEVMDEDCKELLLNNAIVRLQEEIESQRELVEDGRVEDNNKPGQETLHSDDNPA